MSAPPSRVAIRIPQARFSVMPIAAQCTSCSVKFQVKDEWAGKRVKCPKCSKPFQIPKPAAPKQKPKAQGGADTFSLAPAVPRQSNPMLDLLDDVGVESTPRGPVCNNCGSELSTMAIICVECGFNNETGKQLETTTYKEPGVIDEGMTDAEKMLARAEQEIDETPVSAKDQDFGDGADSFLIAAVALVVAAILIGTGVGIILVMDKVGENINTALISMFGSLAIYVFCAAWISFFAFRAKAIHGLGCLLSAGLYCIVFGFMQGKALFLQAAICCAAIAIGIISYLVYTNSEGRSSMLLIEAVQIVTTV